MSLKFVRQILLYQQTNISRLCRRHMSISKDLIPQDMDIQDSGVTINLLSEDAGENIYIKKYNSRGFELSSGLKISGPCVFFPRSFLSWKVSGLGEVNANSLALFSMITPKLDLLVLGTGVHGEKIDPGVLKFLREKKINFEILTTEHAIATFNFLNMEQRWVAAGMIPPQYKQSYLQDEIREHLASQRNKDQDYLTDHEDELETLETGTDSPPQIDQIYDKVVREKGELHETNMFGFKILRSPLEMENTPEKSYFAEVVDKTKSIDSVSEKSENNVENKNTGNKEKEK